MPALDEVYDEATLGRMARLDPAAELVPTRAPHPTWRQRTAAGAITTALALGLREVFDPPADEPVVEEVDVGRLAADLAVTVVLVPGAPQRSRATVRPWLLPGAALPA